MPGGQVEQVEPEPDERSYECTQRKVHQEAAPVVGRAAHRRRWLLRKLFPAPPEDQQRGKAQNCTHSPRKALAGR
jgi:hypothetical protein